MQNANNPAVNLETRAFLRKLIDEENGLDESCVALLERAIDHVKTVSPSGWVYLLATSLGAKYEDAIEAGSIAEMYYVMCSFTDDVQDGDAGHYMTGLDHRMLVNVMAQLICVTVVRTGRFTTRLGRPEAIEELSRAFMNGAVMLRGQRIELLRECWSVKSYRRVAVLSGGRQFDVYFRLAALAAGVSPDTLLPLSDPLAILVQMKHDEASGDPRLVGLPLEDVSELRREAASALQLAARSVIGKSEPMVRAILNSALEQNSVMRLACQ